MASSSFPEPRPATRSAHPERLPDRRGRRSRCARARGRGGESRRPQRLCQTLVCQRCRLDAGRRRILHRTHDASRDEQSAGAPGRAEEVARAAPLCPSVLLGTLSRHRKLAVSAAGRCSHSAVARRARLRGAGSGCAGHPRGTADLFRAVPAHRRALRAAAPRRRRGIGRPVGRRAAPTGHHPHRRAKQDSPPIFRP